MAPRSTLRPRRLGTLQLAVLSLTLFIPSVAMAQKRPITHEDVWLAKRLSGTAVSPAGRWVAVHVTEPAYDERDQASDLWLIPTDGRTAARRLTATKGVETGRPGARTAAASRSRPGATATTRHRFASSIWTEARRSASRTCSGAWENAAVWTKQNPLSLAGNLETPMLVTVGERDYRAPVNNAIQLWSALQRMKVPGASSCSPEENHWVLRGENSRFFYNEIHAWLAKWFGSATSSQ